MTAWEKIVELYADEPLVQKTAKAGYAQTCRELVVKYSKDAAFMQEGYPQAKAGFYKWAGELMRAQFYEKDIAICSRRSIHIFLEHLGKTKTG